MRAVGSDDSFFVAFAENKNEIAFFGEVDGFFDGRFSVDDFDNLVSFHTTFLATAFKHSYDFFWIFVARIVFGDNTDIAKFASDFATLGAGRFITATGAAKERDDATRFVGINRFEDFFKSIWSVSEVNNDVEVLSEAKAIHATFNFG